MSQKLFDSSEQDTLAEIIAHRRDIRGNNFLSTPIEKEKLDKILNAASLAPSVGFSQPWEFVMVNDKETRAAIVDDHRLANSAAKEKFTRNEQSKYSELKLEGIIESPINIAVFYCPSNAPVLGQDSMPEMGEYSVVCAIQNMWLTARAMNIGLGWVSILNPETLKSLLNAPREHKLIGYLCIGYVKEFLAQPELEKLQWRDRKKLTIISEKY